MPPCAVSTQPKPIMADEADITSNNAQFDHLQSLYVSRRAEGPKANGHCLNCREPLPPAAPDADGRVVEPRWCDRECQQDWQLRQPRH